ncbi:MAG: hypothetical protein KGM91_27865, partial [Burkholderiales bacterium]|nr:hypothetical protein [Burkholderiales bacterium]
RQHGLLRFIGFTHRVSVPNSFKSAPALKKSATSRLQLPDLGSVDARVMARWLPLCLCGCF